jgi:hypothetical protein
MRRVHLLCVCLGYLVVICLGTAAALRPGTAPVPASALQLLPYTPRARLTSSLLHAAAWGPLTRPHSAPQCFEEDCRGSPFIMHASRTVNLTGSSRGIAVCFAFVAIGCWAAPKGCCPMVARKFRALEFAVSE